MLYLGEMKRDTVLNSLHSHVEKRVEALYPRDIYTDDEGAVPPALLCMVPDEPAGHQNEGRASKSESAYDMKQSTMPDAPDNLESVFADKRPTLVVGEATTDGAIDKNMAVEHAVGSVNGMTLEMSSVFDEQFHSQYMPRIFQGALNYDCGGADYPDLFSSYDEDKVLDHLRAAVPARWRRAGKEAMVSPGEYKQMMATRPESQLTKDWLFVPAAQNLHWRWQVLKSSFLNCKQKVKPGETLAENLDALIEAARTIFTRVQSGKVKINGKVHPINGEIAMLFRDDALNSTERVLLTSYLKTTSIQQVALASAEWGVGLWACGGSMLDFIQNWNLCVSQGFWYQCQAAHDRMSHPIRF